MPQRYVLRISFIFIAVYEQVHAGACGRLKRTSGPLKLELQAVVSHLAWAKWRSRDLRVLPIMTRKAW